MFKGTSRERNLNRSEYYSDRYFSLPTLLAFVTQIHTIHALRPASVLEIGVGNGFVSSFLRRSGFDVLTADINPDLDPDICAPLSELPNHLDRKFDLVVCCEVLEHMPLVDLDSNLDILRDAGSRLFMTLPNSYSTIGLGGLFRLPRIGNFLFDAHLTIPRKHNLNGSPHFWEVGYNSDCTRSNIVTRLKRRYSKVTSHRNALNPYHFSFLAS